MDTEPPNLYELIYLLDTVLLSDSGFVFSLFFLLLMIVSSAMISGSEVAFFSLSPQDVNLLREEDTKNNKRILRLRERPRQLLATILISNNLINIGIVVLSYFLINHTLSQHTLVDFSQSVIDVLNISFIAASQLAAIFYGVITVFGVTAILLLFGEVAPKTYANINNLSFSRKMALPLSLLDQFLSPLSKIMVRWSNNLEGRLNKDRLGSSVTTKEDLDAAIELAALGSDTTDQEADILKSILKFGDVTVKQIMKSRMDVVAVEDTISFQSLLETIKEHGYSRIPVYKEDFDNIIGILYVKDLLGYTKESPEFDWKTLIRPNPLYTPEQKKIDDLLKEIQQKRVHIAIVVDEFGGSSGIVTLEDIMEEVIGDIKDEYDEEEEVDYVKLSENNYVFDGKTLLNDVCRITGLDLNMFQKIRGESDSLAGLVLEIEGIMPKVDKEVLFDNLKFKIISVTNRRIEKINVQINSTID